MYKQGGGRREEGEWRRDEDGGLMRREKGRERKEHQLQREPGP